MMTTVTDLIWRRAQCRCLPEQTRLSHPSMRRTSRRAASGPVAWTSHRGSCGCRPPCCSLRRQRLLENVRKPISSCTESPASRHVRNQSPHLDKLLTPNSINHFTDWQVTAQTDNRHFRSYLLDTEHITFQRPVTSTFQKYTTPFQDIPASHLLSTITYVSYNKIPG